MHIGLQKQLSLTVDQYCRFPVSIERP